MCCMTHAKYCTITHPWFWFCQCFNFNHFNATTELCMNVGSTSSHAAQTRLFTLIHFQIWCYVCKFVGFIRRLRSSQSPVVSTSMTPMFSCCCCFCCSCLFCFFLPEHILLFLQAYGRGHRVINHQNKTVWSNQSKWIALRSIRCCASARSTRLIYIGM